MRWSTKTLIGIAGHVAVPFAACFLFALAPPVRAQQDVLATLYQEAQSAETAGNYALATQKYERIVALRPDMAEAHANLGNLYYVQGQAAQAEASFKKALQRKPGLFAPHLMLGILAFHRHDFDQAARHLTTALQLDSSNALANQYLGYTYYATSRYGESAVLLEKVVAQDGGNLDAWYHLSKVYGQLSKQYFELLQKQYPDSFETHLARSHFHESSANWAEAREQLSKALARQPENETLVRRINWLERKATTDTVGPPSENGDPTDGSTRYLHNPPSGNGIQSALSSEGALTKSSLKIAPPTAQSFYHLAEGYQAQSFLTALWLFQNDPDSFRAHQLRAQSLEASGRLDEAVKSYREALARKPDLQTIHFAIGNIYWRNARMDDALPELEAELKLNPRDAQAHYEIADILLSQSKTQLAEKHFEEAVQLSPSMTEAHLALEKIATANGDYQKALAHLKKVAKLEPRNPTPHYRMWLLYRRLGKTAEAQLARNVFEKLKEKGGGQIPN